MNEDWRVYNRPMLMEVLVRHQRGDGGDCSCGWDAWGESWAVHVADAYEARLERLREILRRMHRQEVVTGLPSRPDTRPAASKVDGQ